MRSLVRSRSFRLATSGILFGLLVLGVSWALSSSTQAQDRAKEQPKVKRDAEPDVTKAEARAAEELKKLQAIFPEGTQVTIFSKDYGPAEGVFLIKIIEFRGKGYFHVRNGKDNKDMLLCCESITQIRAD